MKKDFLKYILIGIFACLSFMFIDDVYASSGVYFPSVGTFKQEVYELNTLKNSTTSLTVTRVAGKAFSGISANSSASFRSTFVHRFFWTFPGSIIKGYDSIGFTIGFSPGYVNSSTFLITTSGYESGWLTCDPISLPGSGNDYGYQFSSFTCSLEGIEFDSSKTYNLWIDSNAIGSYVPDSTSSNPNAPPMLYNPGFLFGTDLILYNAFENAVVSSIKEQTEAINKQTESIDKVQDSITDSDTSDATDSAGSFFSGFETEDNGGLSAIITAPLKFIEKATDSCSPLTLTAFDTDIELPCGDTLFWNKPEVASFRTVWNTIIGGSILFMILRKVFKVVENAKDPEHDKVEVMKL